jgi:hypothetical protein
MCSDVLQVALTLLLPSRPYPSSPACHQYTSDNQVEDVDTIQLDYHDQRVCAYVSRFIIPRGENPAREDLALPHLWPPYPRWVAAPVTTTRRPRQDFGCEHPFPCGFAPGGGLVHR